MTCDKCGGTLNEHGDCPYCGSKRIRVENGEIVRFFNVDENEVQLVAQVKIPMYVIKDDKSSKEYIRNMLVKSLADEILKNEDMLCNTSMESDMKDMCMTINKRIRLKRV